MPLTWCHTAAPWPARIDRLLTELCYTPTHHTHTLPHACTAALWRSSMAAYMPWRAQHRPPKGCTLTPLHSAGRHAPAQAAHSNHHKNIWPLPEGPLPLPLPVTAGDAARCDVLGPASGSNQRQHRTAAPREASGVPRHTCPLPQQRCTQPRGARPVPRPMHPLGLTQQQGPAGPR